MIYISSPSGSVDIAVELFNFLKLLDCKITTVNLSCVNSAAIIIFAAGDERIRLPCSSFYVHSITKNLNRDFTAADLLREVKEMLANTDKYQLYYDFFVGHSRHTTRHFFIR